MMDEIQKLEKELQAADEKIQAALRNGKIPTSDDYADVDRIKANLKVARRVRAMDAKRIDPKRTRKISILLSDDEFQRLSKKAEAAGIDLSKYIRDLLRNQA